MSNDHFTKVRDYLVQLDISIDREDVRETLFLVSDESRGIRDCLIDCEDDLLILEQMIMKLSCDQPEFFKKLLIINRELTHGAFVLDASGRMVLFRDTLQLENLDLNELEASINALAMGLAEHAETFIHMARDRA
ncbi:MAG: YbjN domain-containing protein [Magnetococcales bacterium]|nr:YbjN domain-containing protein [Magnetococcales bacterium]